MDTAFGMIHRLSLKKKIIFWSLVASGLTLVLFSIVSLILVRIKLLQELDNRLVSASFDVGRSISVSSGNLDITPGIEWEEEHHTSAAGTPIFIVLLDVMKYEIRRSVNADGKALPLEMLSYREEQSAVSSGELNGARWRFATTPLQKDGRRYGWIVVGMPFDRIDHILAVLLTMYAILFPISMVFAFLGSYCMANKALLPVQTISSTVRNIRAKNLDQKLAVSESDDEIAHLAITINDLLARLQGSFTTDRKSVV